MAFFIREWRAPHPELPLWILTHPSRAASCAIQFLTGVAQMGAFLYLTYYYQNFLGYTPLKIPGLHSTKHRNYVLAMVLTLVLTALSASRLLVPHLGTKGLFPLGLAIQAVAFFILAHLTVNSTYEEVSLPGLILYRIGVGLIMPMTFNAGTRGVGEHRSGLASAVLSSSQQIGSSFGVALLATFATHRIADYLNTHTEALRADISHALTQAKAAPNTEAGQQIIEQMRKQTAASAQISAYSGGFALLAWILAVSTMLSVIAVASFLVYQRKTVMQSQNSDVIPAKSSSNAL